MKKILLVRTDKIGDALLTTPCLKIIKENLPDAQTDFWATAQTAPLFYYNTYVNRVLFINPFKNRLAGCLDMIRRIRNEKYDAAVLFYVDFPSAIILFLSGIPLRIGPFSKIWSLFLNKRIRQRRSRAYRHEAEYNAELVRTAFGFKYGPLYPLIFLHDDEKKKSQEQKKIKWPAASRIIGIHPSGRGSNLLLPKERYFQIIEYLLTLKDCGILITGLEDEIKDYRARFGRHTGVFLPGDGSLRELISLISPCSLFITNSTGPLHIASALGIRTLSFFSPVRVTKPVRWGPLYKNSSIKYKILVPEDMKECKKCRPGKCRYFNCLSLIPLERIKNEIDFLLENK